MSSYSRFQIRDKSTTIAGEFYIVLNFTKVLHLRFDTSREKIFCYPSHIILCLRMCIFEHTLYKIVISRKFAKV